MRRTGISIILLACCCHPDPKINSFSVTPAGYCPSGSQKIHVEWNTAKGATTLQIEPDDPAPRAVAAKGSLDIDAHDVVVTLAVTDGNFRPHVIQPVHAVGRRPLNDIAMTCKDGWVETKPAEFGGGPNAYAADVHPAVISNKCAPNASATSTCRRHATVLHAGKTWDIGPDAVLDVTKDETPMSGPWTLRQQLLAGEQCESQSAEGALAVELTLEVGCTKGVTYEQ
jgi:hypothetical protein